MLNFEKRAINELLTEVVSWLATDSLLQGCSASIQTLTYRSEADEIEIRIVDSAEWYSDIKIANDNSKYVELMKQLSLIGQAFGLFHQIGAGEYELLYDSKVDEMHGLIVRSERVVEVATALCVRHESKEQENIDLQVEQLRLTVLPHFAGIMQARVTTLSRRHALSEALFFAYRSGLLPFGWDWDSLLCVNPNVTNV